MSRTDTRESLLRERRQCADELAAALLSRDADVEKPHELMGRIEMLDSALAAFPKSTRSDLWRLAIVGLVTGLVVTVLLVKEAYFVPVILDIHSRTLSADVDSAGSLSAISLARYRINSSWSAGHGARCRGGS